MGVRGESGHINANYSKNGFGAIRPDASNRVNSIYSMEILVAHIAVNFIIKRCNVLIQFVDVQENNTQHLLLKRRKDTLQIVQYLLWRCFEIADNQIRQIFMGNFFVGNKHVKNVAGTLTVDIGDGTRKLNVAAF